MHKKIVALFALVALVCGAMFADVAVKALDGDNVEVTFTIKAPASQLVVITGPSPFFPNWSPDGIPMTQREMTEYGLTLSQQKNLMRLFISSFWMEPGLQTPTPRIQSMTGTVERTVWFL